MSFGNLAKVLPLIPAEMTYAEWESQEYYYPEPDIIACTACPFGPFLGTVCQSRADQDIECPTV